MKTVVLSLSLLVISQFASAKIVYTDFNPDSVLNFTLPPTSTYESDSGIVIDFDKDGQKEFHFSYEIFSNIAGISWKVQLIPSDTANQAIWAGPNTYGGNHYAKALVYGDTIGSFAGFGVDSGPLLGNDQNGNFEGLGDRYIGIRFRKAGKVYYGWILVSLKSSGSSGTLTVKSMAYQDVSNLVIYAGVPCTDSYATFKAESCFAYIWNGKKYDKTGVYYDTIPNADGCDSIMTLNFSYNTNDSSFKVITCSAYNWLGNVYSQSGTYYDTLKNAKGCDSLMTLNLTILSSDTVVFVRSCESYTWNGKTLTQSGTYLDTLVNRYACDSFITLELDIARDDTAVSRTACEAYVWNGNILTQSGIYVDTFTNRYNCDSVVELNLDILNTTAQVKDSACREYTWLGKTYTESGIYVDTIPNQAGCDSIITLDLTIQSTSAIFNESACFEFVWLGKTLDKSGTYSDTLVNSAGCDSLVTLNLTIKTVNTNVTDSTNKLIAVMDSASYQWLDCDNNYAPVTGETNQYYVITQTGSYAVEITHEGCVDTSLCYDVEVIGVSPVMRPASIRIYPNPTTGLIKIEQPVIDGAFTIRLLNLSGKVVQEYSLDGNSTQEIMLDVPAGCYLLEVYSDTENLGRIQVIKQD